jgi:hypothetical protein
MDGVTVSASDINSVTAKAPIDGATFTGTTTIPTADINGGAIDGAIIGANSAAAVTATGLTISGGTATQLQTSSSSVDGNIFADVQNTNTGSSSGIVQRMITSNVAGNGTISADFQKTKAGALNINNNETNSAAFIGLSIGGGEKFRFGSSGQLGIGGATYGTSGQVLTSGGASAAPTWADAGGGAYELITKTTISSNVTEIIFDSVSAPQQQLLLLINGLQVSNTGSIIFHYRNSSGGNLNNTGGSSDTYRNTGYYSVLNSAIGYAGNSTGNGIYIGYSQTWPGQDFNASFRIFNFGTTATGLQGTSNQMGGGSTNFQSQGIDSQAVTSAATAGIRLYITNSREFTTGEVYLYKLV